MAPPSPRGMGRPTVSGSSATQMQTQFAQNMAKSMTIEEMRYLHQRALHDADAKRTELKLVLASRYRELVGSSDEVIKMKERSQELHDLVQAIPSLMEKLTKPPVASAETKIPTEGDNDSDEEDKKEEEKISPEELAILKLRRELSDLPRVVHRALDRKDVHKATFKLIQLFTLIASQTNIYPLANALSTLPPTTNDNNITDRALNVQMRMIYLQVQTLPDKIRRIASRIIAKSASYGKSVSCPSAGAQMSAATLATLDFLETENKHDRAERLLSTYYDAKAKLLVSLVGKLSSPSSEEGNNDTGNAEEILSKIVLILQYDILMHPYQIFVLRSFPEENPGDAARIMKTMPNFDKDSVRAKSTKFLATHLPLIRSKVKSVLVTIAGTTASALGQIRQSLYDKTDGNESMERLNDNGICTWDEAVASLVDIHAVLNSAGDSPSDATLQKFSLWGALFSNTFSSLVHSLLTTAFQSVHTRVISTLRLSLASAPPLSAILPHEAYRNTLKIATELDKSLLKVSEDAYELLVHAEEREESERRLRQSLYVQTCEIMGRLICELRRMAFRESTDDSDATKELIVGRLCYLLKFRLTSLPTLLSSESSPVSMRNTIGMISFVDLQSAFELADHDEDGLITFEEAMEAVESAFAGTPFRGAEMVKDTLLLSADGKEARSGKIGSAREAPTNITLNELMLLTARGLRHAKSGPESALGTLQRSLDDIVEDCFQKWALAALTPSCESLDKSMRIFLETANIVSEEEWRRMFVDPDGLSGADFLKGISPHVVGFLLNCASTLNRNSCPSDSLPPVPTKDQAFALGIHLEDGCEVPSLMDSLKLAILGQSLHSVASMLNSHLLGTSDQDVDLEDSCSSARVQLHADISFFVLCYSNTSETASNNFGREETMKKSIEMLQNVSSRTNQLLQASGIAGASSIISDKQQHAYNSSDLFLSSLFGGTRTASVSSAGELLGGAGGSSPFFYVPLASSRRFVLLPVQADRSLSEIQMRGKYAKEKTQTQDRQESATGKVMSSGFGFFSNMLKKK